MPARPRAAHARAFSLLELSLVIAIMGILMAIVAVNLVGGADNTRKQATIASMRTIQTGVEQYIANNGVPPTGLDVLIASGLIKASAGGGPPLDAWERPFYFAPAAPGATPAFALVSMGKDGLPQTEDDINAWDHLQP
jgi:general secretion pathway protein G